MDKLADEKQTFYGSVPMMKFEIIEARYKFRTGIGCDGMHRDDDVVCKAYVEGENKPLYFLYTTEVGGLFGVTFANLFLKKYESPDNEPPWEDFYMDGWSDVSQQRLETSKYYPLCVRMIGMAKAVNGSTV